MLHIFLGLGPSLSIRSQSPIVRRGNGWGSTPSFFLAGLAALPWGLLRPMSPSARTLDWGWGFFTVPPRLGRPATWCMCPRACGHLSANAALIVPPRQPHAAEWRPPGEVPPGTHSGRRACVVLGTASEPRIYIWPSRSRWPEPNPLVAPGRVAPSARQI